MADTAFADSASSMVDMTESTLGADTAIEETPVETPVEEPIPEEAEQPIEAAAEEEPIPEEEPVAEAETPPEELPEGVSREAKGLRVTEPRWKAIYGDHQFVAQQAPQIIGEPLTTEALTLRHNALQMQEQFYTDQNSGDPAIQGKVLDFQLGEMARAFKDGEVGVDPTVPFTQAFYEKIQAHPDAHAALRFSAAKDLIAEMYEAAAQSNDPSLFSSAQHMSRMLAGVKPEFLKGPNGIATLRATAERMGIPFYTQEEMAGIARGADPVAQMRAENEQLRSQLNGRQASTQTAQFDTWKSTTNQAIAAGIADDAVKPALASIAEAWKEFPKEYQEEIVAPLHREVNRILGEDSAFQQQIRSLGVQAQRATSPAVRDRLTQNIRQLYVNRAQRAIEASKQPIIRQGTERLKGRSTANHARRAAGQSQTAPKGPTTAVPRNVTDGIDKNAFLTNGIFDPAKAMRVMSGVLPR